MVDRELILRKIAALEEYLDQLGEFRSLSVEAYRTDWKTQRIVDRTLHMAIETCLDVGDHLIADRRLRAPSTQAETFEILRDAGLLPASLAESLVRMARFRNLLVHEYATLEPAKVVAILHDSLDDLRSYRDEILKLA